MDSSTFSALIAYLLPVIGWIFVGVFQRKDSFAMFHLRQSIGSILFLLVMFVVWMVAGWIIAWIPYMFVFSVALYTLFIVAFLVVVVSWIVGMANALRGKRAFLPFFGRLADRWLSFLG